MLQKFHKNAKYLLVIIYLLGRALNAPDFAPSGSQISALVLFLFIILNYVKDDMIEDNKVIFRFDTKKYYIMYYVIFIQILFLTSNFGLAQPIIDWIVFALIILTGLYFYFK